MKYDVRFTHSDVEVILSETLPLPEGQLGFLGAISSPQNRARLDQLEALVREFLEELVSPPASSPE